METRLLGHLDRSIAQPAGPTFHANSDSLASLLFVDREPEEGESQGLHSGSAGKHRWRYFPPRATGCPQLCWCAAEQGALGFSCALCTPGAGYLNNNRTKGRLGGKMFLCLHGLLLAAAVQQPTSPPLSISFPLSWKD